MMRAQQSRHALGSDAVLTLVLPDGEPFGPAFYAMWNKIEDFERRFSRFQPGSELSRFNAGAGTECAVSPEFVALLTAAKQMAERTGGLYSPFILPALQRAGYKGSWPHPDAADNQLDYADKHGAAWRNITIGNGRARIPKQTALDFGGIGKGYLLDELAGWLEARGVDNYWLSLGGDILCTGYDASGKPWQVSVQAALQADVSVAGVTNNGQRLAVATSGVTKRKGIKDGKPWHHLIDPRTDEPAKTDVLTATVCTVSATEADVLAKCLVIIGGKAACGFMVETDLPNALLQLQKPGGGVEVAHMGAVWSR